MAVVYNPWPLDGAGGLTETPAKASGLASLNICTLEELVACHPGERQARADMDRWAKAFANNKRLQHELQCLVQRDLFKPTWADDIPGWDRDWDPGNLCLPQVVLDVLPERWLGQALVVEQQANRPGGALADRPKNSYWCPRTKVWVPKQAKKQQLAVVTGAAAAAAGPSGIRRPDPTVAESVASLSDKEAEDLMKGLDETEGAVAGGEGSLAEMRKRKKAGAELANLHHRVAAKQVCQAGVKLASTKERHVRECKDYILDAVKGAQIHDPDLADAFPTTSTRSAGVAMRC